MTSQTAIGAISQPAFFRATTRAIKSQRLIIAGQFFLSFFSRCTSRDLQQRKKAFSFFFSWRSRDVQRRKKAQKKAQCVATLSPKLFANGIWIAAWCIALTSEAGEKAVEQVDSIRIVDANVLWNSNVSLQYPRNRLGLNTCRWCNWLFPA